MKCQEPAFDINKDALRGMKKELNIPLQSKIPGWRVQPNGVQGSR